MADQTLYPNRVRFVFELTKCIDPNIWDAIHAVWRETGPSGATDGAPPYRAFPLFSGNKEDYRDGDIFAALHQGDFPLCYFWGYEPSTLPIDILDKERMIPRLFDFTYAVQEQKDLKGQIRSVELDLPIELLWNDTKNDWIALSAGTDGLASSSGSGPVINCATEADWSLKKIKAHDAWRHNKGAGVIVGHPDTGAAPHDKLDPALVLDRGKNFVEGTNDATDPLDYSGSPGHGTATSSVIVGRGSGGPDELTGVAPEAELVPIRTCNKVWWLFSSDLASAMVHAAGQGCHVISMSLGGTPLKSLRMALNFVVNHNLLVVAAAGNEVGVVVYPAKYENCVALAATNPDDQPWSGSSRGKSVTLSAPGAGVCRALRKKPNDPSRKQVEASNGTSYATATTAGAAALWLAHHGRNSLIARKPNGAPLQALFMHLLQQTARDPGGWNPHKYGAGILNASDLLNAPIPAHLPAAARWGRHGSGDESFAFARLVELLDTEQGPAEEFLKALFWNPENRPDLYKTFENEISLLLIKILGNLRPPLTAEEAIRSAHNVNIMNDLKHTLCKEASASLRRALGSNCPQNWRGG